MSLIQYMRMGTRTLTSHPGTELINEGLGFLLVVV